MFVPRVRAAATDGSEGTGIGCERLWSRANALALEMMGVLWSAQLQATFQLRCPQRSTLAPQIAAHFCATSFNGSRWI
jgi:hypothetical protein